MTMMSRIDAPACRRLGTLSERYESGGRGPGTVSSGRGDPGGVSYGTYQLASRTGTLAAFLRSEGAHWAGELVTMPGSAEFASAWKAIAARAPQAFAEAQHAFIARSHYRPAVSGVLRCTGLDLDTRHPAVRDAVWSVAVQHGGAVRILSGAVSAADEQAGRETEGYDRALVEAIYALRSAYVRSVASRLSGAQQRQLLGVVEKRYPAERAEALAMLDESPPI